MALPLTDAGLTLKLPDDLLHRLRHLLDQQVTTAPGACRLVLPLVRFEAGQLLDWLAAQPVFPQFYWMHRDGSEEVAALGEVCRFSTAAQASAFVAAQAAPFRLWGGVAFDATAAEGEGLAGGGFFLPRFELRQGAGGAELAINLWSPHSLAADAAAARLQLHELQAATRLRLPQVRVVATQQQPDQVQWCALVDASLAAIACGHFNKVVLARKTTLQLDGALSPAQLLAASRQVNHRCFHFMLAYDAHHGLVGSSPERLYSRYGLSLHTEAVAGTVACTGQAGEDRALACWLLSDDKNRRENSLVVEDICARLDGHVDALQVDAAQVLAFRKVQHVRRRIVGRLRGGDDAQCLARLHATAAVAGVPREPARQFIRAHEPFARGWYAGSVGYLSRARAEFAVAIRCALVQPQQIHLFAGAGLVPGSDAAAEWQELGRKTAGLQTLLEPDLVNECF
jgi:menaquinone-specific isochorismate synthase